VLLDLHAGALVDTLSGATWSPAEVTRLAAQRTAELQGAGLRPGQRVIVPYSNRREFFVDLLALWRCGACAVPIDPRLTSYEIGNIVAAVQPTHAVWVDGAEAALGDALDHAGVPRVDWRARAHPASGPAHIALDADALILFTSGTTGTPKGVVHTHRSLRARWNVQREVMGIESFERTLCAVPSGFAWGLIGNCLYPWLSGRTLVTAPAFRNDIALRLGALCDEFQITYLPLVPALWKMVVKMAPPPRTGTLRSAASGTAPLHAMLWEQIANWCGTRDVFNIYGITETGWIAGRTLRDGPAADGNVGRPWGCQVRVLDSGATDGDAPYAHAEKAAGDVGHVWVQSASLMRGYFNRDADTRAAIAAGWFSTGDLGRIDTDGALTIVGRDKDMISVGGIKVYPEDIDAVLLRHPEVTDACAFAGDDALQGESVATALVLRSGDAGQLASVFAWAAQHLARHQLPRRWYVVREIARSARGKLIRADVARACAAGTPVEQAALEKQLRAAATA
jgi:acyl-CoA synthetase (AMP-forming)/AMP-acid ligase II